ncbi:MAG: HAMP domain-containing protein [Proteobacteria bacterium]|nr:HAMP domain-containing protein [Pseudomonadota bacterium]
MSKWLKLQNIPIAAKICLIVALFAAVSIGTAGFTALRMAGVDAKYSDLIARVAASTTLAAQSERSIATFESRAYELVVETTTAGDKRLLADAAASQKSYESTMAKVRVNIPEQAAIVDAAVAKVRGAFNACEPVLRFAASATSAEDNGKATARLKAECDPLIRAGEQAQLKLTDRLIAYAESKSNGLTQETYGTIWSIVLLIGSGLLATIAVALWIGVQGLSRPIGRLNAVMQAFARNDLAANTPGVGRGDEVGSMARTVEVFKVSMIEADRLRAEQAETAKRMADEQRKAMHGLADKFEASTGSIVANVTAQATELRATAQSMASISEETSRQASTVAAASEQATQNVNTVAVATEELAASVREIVQQIAHSSELTNATVTEANAANSDMQALASAMERIGQVVGLISGIAGQTNLLALNATIEAARAGDAGKGFAVVASEVKALANQTAKATDDISTQIAAIQAATKGSVLAIQSIAARIGKVSETASAIAAAVEEQGAATAEIARNVAEAAKGTSEVSSNIVGVNSAAQSSGAAAGEVLTSASSLSQNSEALKAQVDRFLHDVRAA